MFVSECRGQYASRRKPAVKSFQLLDGTDALEAFQSGDLVQDLKKALAERMQNSSSRPRGGAGQRQPPQRPQPQTGAHRRWPVGSVDSPGPAGSIRSQADPGALAGAAGVRRKVIFDVCAKACRPARSRCARSARGGVDRSPMPFSMAAWQSSGIGLRHVTSMPCG